MGVHMESKEIRSVGEFLADVQHRTSGWFRENFSTPWFRGQRDAGQLPIPSIFRRGYYEREATISATFRLRAPAFGNTPATERLDQWLFLMQHFGLPTRLLDWTESPLIALYFAVDAYFFVPAREIQTSAGVWVLNPIALNRLTFPDTSVFPNTWTEGPVLENFKLAFGTAGKDPQIDPHTKEVFYHQPTQYPVAVQPSFVHPRVASQRGCFTIHGRRPEDFESIAATQSSFGESSLLKYAIKPAAIKPIIATLFDLGISPASVFPDLDGLAQELKLRTALELRL